MNAFDAVVTAAVFLGAVLGFISGSVRSGNPRARP